MHAVGIICEYNPFHNGHALQLAAARKDSGADVVVAVMSEYLTQRGELTIVDPYTRAAAALACGVDLVVGLPFPYSAAPAEFFALAGVRILHAMHVDALHFGSECADIPRLENMAQLLYSPSFIRACTAWLDAHPTYGILDARTTVCRELGVSDVPCGSNDLLGMAYLNAVKRVSPTMSVLTVPRNGRSFNDTALSTDATPDSATALRKSWLQNGLDSLRGRIPKESYDRLSHAFDEHLAPVRSDTVGQALLSYYRLADSKTLAAYAELDGGVAERLCSASRMAPSFASMLEIAATKRYTHARLRRALWYGICEVPKGQLSAPPPYIRLLAANQTGCAYLSALRRTCSLPIVTKPSRIPQTPQAMHQRRLEERLESLYTLALPVPTPACTFAKAFPFIEQTGESL